MKLWARSALSRMPNNASRERSEGIDGISLGTRPYKRFQTSMIGDIDGYWEQVVQISRDPDVLEQTDWCVWLKLDQDVDVAGGLRFAASD